MLILFTLVSVAIFHATSIAAKSRNRSMRKKPSNNLTSVKLTSSVRYKIEHSEGEKMRAWERG